MNDNLNRTLLDSMLGDLRRGHSNIQMDAFITARNGALNVWGMYQQALLELSGRYQSLQAQSIEQSRRLTDLQAAELAVWPKWVCLGQRLRLKRTRALLAVREAKLALKAVSDALPHLEREFWRFFGQCQVLRERLPDVLTPGTITQLDTELWTTRLKVRLAADMIRDGRPGRSHYQIMPTLPTVIRSELSKCEADPDELVAWYRNLRAEASVSPSTIERVGWAANSTDHLIEH